VFPVIRPPFLMVQCVGFSPARPSRVCRFSTEEPEVADDQFWSHYVIPLRRSLAR
jgi:hypothetical protein